MDSINRRSFLKTSGIVMLPALIPFNSVLANENFTGDPATPMVNFYSDGVSFKALEYINELQKINISHPIKRDQYASGGVVEELEKKFAELTGKEKAIFMPSGTMANQLAISVLSEEKTKIFVQDTSHVYRDEADAAQSVFNKRLMPLAKDRTYFTAAELQKAIDNLEEEEVFESGIGAISIENPVRRTNGGIVPIEEIRKISAYCKSKNIKMHLDGARLYIASAWSGVSIKDYTANFDTVYISLYKYLGAGAGAILCGDKAVIDKMPHLIKIHGGNMAENWFNAAMALHKLNGVDTRFADAKKRSVELFAEINKMPQLKITEISGGSNIYMLQLPKNISGEKFCTKMFESFKIALNYPNEENEIELLVNETILYQNVTYIIDALKKSLV
ncbi:MAG: aminotransferase class I/II-fold pyridoxal phosphate-dependent enzyme [Bacteroidetes bacterium]|nr:aminotransferase class I/II-fold pyridoxal phosphate-dependent enzyme [Bacteroidota bacterium]